MRRSGFSTTSRTLWRQPERARRGSAMGDQEMDQEIKKRRDDANWAKPTEGLTVTGDVPKEAINLNVTGRRVTSPIQGFGKMWHKTYKVQIGDHVEPVEVIETWKQNFSSFWPPRNNFYGPITGIAPGEVALLNL